MKSLKTLFSVSAAILSTVLITGIKEKESITCFIHKYLKPDIRIEQFENGLHHKVQIIGDNRKMNILDRMDHYNVPGVSIAVVDKGKIAWAKTYGNKSIETSSRNLDTNTMFQAGSISKAVTAFGALILVQEGKVSLDKDINSYLKRWKVPENSFTSQEKVTLRRLLSHTAGTTVHGFPGYSTQNTVPNIVDILNGKQPLVNTEPIRVSSVPGSEYRYSGGGTTIVQLLIEDVTGEDFDVWMKSNVLEPLGMSNSTFSQSLNSEVDNLAIAHLNTGKRVKGDKHIYPEMAAAGLWSTPSDLAKFTINIQSGLQEGVCKVLDSSLVREMVTKQQIAGKDIDSGLGVFLQEHKKNLTFGHDGVDEGFIARMNASAHHGQGFVVMVNSDKHSLALLDEITHSIQDSHRWPMPSPIKRTKVELARSTLDRFPGIFSIEDNDLEITLSNGKLYIDLGLGKWELHPSNEHRFFIEQMDIEVDFDELSTPAASFVIYQDGKSEGVMVRKHHQQ